MSLYPLLLIAFLFPLFGYLLVLGLINRRRAPLMVPGTWDFVGVLLGMSGFILAGSGYLLYQIAVVCRSFGLGSALLWLFAVLYLLLVVLIVLFVLVQRRRYTVVYNVNPRTFE